MPEITIFTDAAWMRRADELIAEYSFKSWAGRLALGDLYPPDEAADAEPETAFNSLADLANLPIWVAWREEKKPDGSLTKVPKNPRTGGNASVPTNPRTYGTRAAAERRAEQITKTTKGGIGVVLGPLPNGQHLAAIDLDSCRDVASGAITPRAQEVIRRFNTYAEISPSNTGVKFFFQMTAVDIVALYKLLGFNHNGEQIKRKSFEPGDHREMAIDTARFYAVTDQRLEDYPETFRLVPFSDVAWFLKTAGPNYLAAAQQSKNAFEASGDRQRADRDQSGSGHGFRFMQDCHADGMDYEQARAAILADESKAGEWANRVDERQLERAWKRSKAEPEMWPSTEMATDLGNARRLVRLYGNDLRYVHLWRKWLAWQGGHWRRDDDGCVMRKAKAAVEEMFAEAAKINDEARRTAMRSHALKSQSAQRLIAMINLAESETGVTLSTEQLDADPYLLGVQNGVIDLRTITFRKAQREDYVTKLAGTAFDPDARCPEWDRFLKKVLSSDDLIMYVQRAVGYVLTGLTGEEVMFILWGHGANGKSTFREIIFALLGNYAAGADASMLVTTKRTGGATPDLARLHGRRLVTINETEQSDMLNESRVKFITGHDVITARNLYQEPFDFTPTHKAFLTTNHKPIVRGTDEGIWRRLHLLPFTQTIPMGERDKGFRERVLMPELPGILNWALEGLRAYQREGLNPPEVVMEATKEYREDMDLVGRWLEERCDLDPQGRAASAALYGDYELWAKAEIGFAMTPIGFGRELSNRGFKKIKVERANGFGGLKLRSLQTSFGGLALAQGA